MIRRLLGGTRARSAPPHGKLGTAALPPFAEDPEYRERLDWALLEHGAVTLYHRANVLAEDQAWLVRAGYRVHELDAAQWKGAADFHAAARAALAFPDWYQPTFASFVDAMAELPVPARGGAAIVIRRYDRFAKAERELAQWVLDAIETTSRQNLLMGRRLLALVQCDDARMRFEAVGTRPVTWNPREWTEEQRGVRKGADGA